LGSKTGTVDGFAGDDGVGALFRFCPACASPRIRFLGSGNRPGRTWVCPDCGFQYYHNVAASAGIVIGTDKGILLIERAKEPRAGSYTLPGGFADPGEGAEEAALRECFEEIGWAPETLHYLGSYANSYRYAGVTYSTCDTFYWAELAGPCGIQFRLDPAESSGVLFAQAESVPWDAISFGSTRRAIRDYLEMKDIERKGRSRPGDS